MGERRPSLCRGAFVVHALRDGALHDSDAMLRVKPVGVGELVQPVGDDRLAEVAVPNVAGEPAGQVGQGGKLIGRQ